MEDFYYFGSDFLIVMEKVIIFLVNDSEHILVALIEL